MVSGLRACEDSSLLMHLVIISRTGIISLNVGPDFRGILAAGNGSTLMAMLLLLGF